METFYSKNYRFYFSIWAYHFSQSCKAQDKYPIGCHCGFSNKPWFCARSAPSPSELASIFNLVGKFGSKIFRMGAEITKIFNFSIVPNWVFANYRQRSFSKALSSFQQDLE